MCCALSSLYLSFVMLQVNQPTHARRFSTFHSAFCFQWFRKPQSFPSKTGELWVYLVPSTFPSQLKKAALPSLTVVYQLADIQGKEVCLLWIWCPVKTNLKRDVTDSLFQTTQWKKLELFQLQSANTYFLTELHNSHNEEKAAGQI